MPDPYDLQRFLEAQGPVQHAVERELAAGAKRSHWMWFVFPQVAGLGSSAMARRYAIASPDEARAYLAHPVLGTRLRHCTDLVNGVEGKPVGQIFGTPDDLKFHSSMTLFEAFDGEPSTFAQALQKYFAGCRDAATRTFLRQAGVMIA